MPISKQRQREAIETALEEAHTELVAGRWHDAEEMLRDALAKLLTLQARPVDIAPSSTNGVAQDGMRSRSIQRGLALLALFDGKRPIWRRVDIASELGLSRSTTHRYASTLVTAGQLEQTTGRRYKRVSHGRERT